MTGNVRAGGLSVLSEQNITNFAPSLCPSPAEQGGVSLLIVI